MGLGPWGIYFLEQELHELSVVTVPANPNAGKKSDNLDHDFDNTIIARMVKIFEEKGFFDAAKEFKVFRERFESVEEKLEKLIAKQMVAKTENPEDVNPDQLKELLDSLNS